MAKIDLSEFLPKGSLDEFLTPSKPEAPQERDVLSSPELVQLSWLRQSCSCGRVYSSQEYGPLIRHTLSRRIGFGLRQVGKVFIPALPNQDFSDIPQEVRIRDEKIYACPECIGRRPSLELFPERRDPLMRVSKAGVAMPLHAALWYDAQATAPLHMKEEVIANMKKRAVDFDDLLMFKTTEIDLQAVAQSLCDPESQIEN